MGSAPLTFGLDGKVAWDKIWTNFCHLALAGGPPHRGTLLEPAAAEEVAADAQTYQQVVEEIGRGIWLVTGLSVLLRAAPGWVGVLCKSAAMAAWLSRAIVVENVLARHEGNMLLVPAGPRFRLAREIKNVVTAVAKTCHYWTAHMPPDQQATASGLLASDTLGTDLLGPATAAEVQAAPAAYRGVVDELVRGVGDRTGLPSVPSRSPGWVGVECGHEEMAVWLLRAVNVENVLARREGSVLYLPAHPRFAGGEQTQKVLAAFAHAWRLWGVYVARK
jgi:hypothetical protein